MTGSDELEILRLLKMPAGDGIGRIYDLIGRRIFFYILGILRSESAAEEVTQNFFVKLVANREKAIRATSLGSYLFQMARNEAVNFCRRTPPSAEPIGSFENVLSYRGLRRNLEELERHKALLRALDQLPDEQQEVISLKIFQEMTFAEIAGALGISANTAASRYRYAVTNLQRIWEILFMNTEDELKKFTSGTRLPSCGRRLWRRQALRLFRLGDRSSGKRPPRQRLFWR